MLDARITPEALDSSVRLRGGGGGVLGSGVRLRPRWVLSLAHLLASPQASIRVESGCGADASVRALHWPGGVRRLRGPQAWPPFGHGPLEDFVLLELDEALPHLRSPLLDVRRVAAGTALQAVGWGVDADGNYPAQPRALPLVAQAADRAQPRFGLAHTVPGHSPRQGHSGAGVYVLGEGAGLLGLHAHREHSEGRERAAYLRLSVPLLGWIQSCTRGEAA
jgi:hypothetical protein